MTLYQDSYDYLSSLCQGRMSIRDFQDKSIPDEMIEKIISIARTSPYASNKKSWEVLVVKEKEIINRIADAVKKVSDQLTKSIRDDLRESFSLYANHFLCFQSAPVLLIPVFRIGKSFSFMMGNIQGLSFSPGQWERDNYIKSISCVGMLILLAAKSLGLGSCYMTGPLLAEKEIHQMLRIKKGRHIGAIIPIGYPKETGAG